METIARKSLSVVALVLAQVLASSVASADEAPAGTTQAPPAEDSWDVRYEQASEAFSAGRLREAASLFHALARTARNERERALTHEMARLASEYADHAEASAHPPSPAPPSPIRTSDELTLMYASGFLYGVGTGVWFLLEAEPDSAITATLPFAAITASPVLAIATIDAIRPLPRGVPHAISAGLYLGLGESVWLVGFQQARATRFRGEDSASNSRFRPETVAAVLWTGSTLGATLGGALGAGLVTTPGRVSFTASTTLWSGVLSGLTAGALLPNDDLRSERAFALGGIGYNAGLVGGLVFAGEVSPTVARVRLADLFAVAGGVVATGAYLSLARDVDVRAAEGLAAGGLGVGLAAGWAITSGMAKDQSPSSKPSQSTTAIQPTFMPVPAGAGVGVGGFF